MQLGLHQNSKKNLELEYLQAVFTRMFRLNSPIKKMEFHRSSIELFKCHRRTTSNKKVQKSGFAPILRQKLSRAL